MMSQANKSAKCPICKAPASVGDVQICGYTEEVLSVASTKDVENAVIFPDKVNIPKPNPCVLSGVRLAMTTLLEL